MTDDWSILTKQFRWVLGSGRFYREEEKNLFQKIEKLSFALWARDRLIMTRNSEMTIDSLKGKYTNFLITLLIDHCLYINTQKD